MISRKSLWKTRKSERFFVLTIRGKLLIIRLAILEKAVFICYFSRSTLRNESVFLLVLTCYMQCVPITIASLAQSGYHVFLKSNYHNFRKISTDRLLRISFFHTFLEAVKKYGLKMKKLDSKCIFFSSFFTIYVETDSFRRFFLFVFSKFSTFSHIFCGKVC